MVCNFFQEVVSMFINRSTLLQSCLNKLRIIRQCIEGPLFLYIQLGLGGLGWNILLMASRNDDAGVCMPVSTQALQVHHQANLSLSSHCHPGELGWQSQPQIKLYSHLVQIGHGTTPSILQAIGTVYPSSTRSLPYFLRTVTSTMAIISQVTSNLTSNINFIKHSQRTD